MKKILFLTPFVPSNRAGGENFTKLLLENLSQDNKIDLLYYRYANDPKYICPNGNVSVVQEVVNSTFFKLKNFLLRPFYHPIFSIRFNRSILSFIQNIVKKNHYDLIFLDHSQMALYGKYFPCMKKIIMSHDVMAQRYSRRGNILSKKLVLFGEKKLLQQPNTTIFSFSEKDRDIIKRVYGIDSYVTNFFLDTNVISAVPNKVDRRIVFFGKWNRLDNFEGLRWFFDNCYDQVSKDVLISIIGKWLPKDFANRVEKLQNVEYLGFVDNPYPIIGNSLASISPVFSGAGVKVKVVESLACGTPVVGSDIAFEGISDKFSEFMLKANSANDYVRIINEINISVTERVCFKQKFLSLYQDQSITSYMGNL